MRRSSSTLPGTLLGALVAAVAVAASASPASAAPPPPPPACGDTLTVDTALTADLTCSGDGLTVAAGLTLDLRGHTLRGAGTGTGVTVATSDAVTIRRGTVTGWGSAVETVPLAGQTGVLVVRDVTLSGSEQGLDVLGDSATSEGAKPTTVHRSTLSGNVRGLVAAFGADVTVHRGSFTDNSDGVLADAAHVTLGRSTFSGNQQGVFLLTSTADLVRPTFTGNANGVVLQSDATVTIGDGRFRDNGTAVLGGTSGNRVDITASTFRANDAAVQLYGEAGSIVGSAFLHNGTAYQSNSASVGGFLLQDNRFRHNGDGIVLLEPDPGTSLGGNDVRHSTGWGILAPGATDLGGNTAKGNGSSPQCTGVVCSTS